MPRQLNHRMQEKLSGVQYVTKFILGRYFYQILKNKLIFSFYLEN